MNGPLLTVTTGGTLTPGTLALIGLTLWAAWRIAAVALYPYVPCSRCQGAARLRSASGKAWRPCPRCKGTGRRLRALRRLWDWSTDRHT